MHSSVVPLLPAAATFAQQVTGASYLQDIFYALASVCLLLVVGCVGLIDAGLVRRKNLLDTWIQKFGCALFAGLGMAIIGYAVWQIQYYQAFGTKNPVGQALHDWSILGPGMLHFSQNLNPTSFPGADVAQIFAVFFVAYAMVGGALLHSAGLERVKPLALYIIAFIAGTVVMPILLYYTWGSTSPLTNRGTHDYIGVYSLYVFVGVWATIIAWRARPRLGAFTSHPRTIGPIPHNLSWSAIGVALLIFTAPFAFLGCGYIVPGLGYQGISLAASGFGLVFMNIFMSYLGGGIAGSIISYRTKNPIMALIGMAAGYICAGTSLDVGHPWSIFICSFLGTFFVYGVYLVLYRLKIDDKKIVPLALGGGVWAVVAGGLIGAGHHTGGYYALTGAFRPDHATITVGHQLFGLVVTVGISVVSGLVVVLALEKTIGLRVPEEVEIVGLDQAYWKAPPSPYYDDPEVTGSSNGAVPVATPALPAEGVGALPHPV